MGNTQTDRGATGRDDASPPISSTFGRSSTIRKSQTTSSTLSSRLRKPGSPGYEIATDTKSQCNRLRETNDNPMTTSSPKEKEPDERTSQNTEVLSQRDLNESFQIKEYQVKRQTTDQHREKITDQHKEKITDQHKEKITDQHKEQITDRHREKITDQYKEKITDQHWENTTDQHRKKITDQYWENTTDQQRENITDQHREIITDQHREKTTDQYKENTTDQHRENITDQHWEKNTDQHRENIADQHWENITDQQRENITDQHWENITDQHWENITDQYWEKMSDQHWENITDQHREIITDQYKEKITDQHWEKTTDQQRENITDQHWENITDQHRENITDQHWENITDRQRENITDQHKEKTTDQQREKNTDQHSENITDQHREKITDQYKEKITDQYKEQITDQYMEKITDQHKEAEEDGLSSDDGKPYPLSMQDKIKISRIQITKNENKHNENTQSVSLELSQGSFHERRVIMETTAQQEKVGEDASSPGLDRGPHPFSTQENIENLQIQISNKEDYQDEVALKSIQMLSPTSVLDQEKMTNNAENEKESVRERCRQTTTLRRSKSVREPRSTLYSCQSPLKESIGFRPRSDMTCDIRLYDNNSDDKIMVNSCSAQVANRRFYPGISEGTPEKIVKPTTSPHPQRRCDNSTGDTDQLDVCPIQEEKWEICLQHPKSSDTDNDVVPNKYSERTYLKLSEPQKQTYISEEATPPSSLPALPKQTELVDHFVSYSYSDQPAIETGPTFSTQENIENSQIQISNKEDDQDEVALKSIQMLSPPSVLDQEKMTNNAENEKESVWERCRQTTTLRRSKSVREPRSTLYSWQSPLKESLGFRPRSDMTCDIRLYDNNSDDKRKVNSCSAQVANRRFYPGISEGTPEKIVKPTTSPHPQRRCDNSTADTDQLDVCPIQKEKKEICLQQPKSSDTDNDVVPNKYSERTYLKLSEPRKQTYISEGATPPSSLQALPKQTELVDHFVSYSYSDQPDVETGPTHVCTRRHDRKENKPTFQSLITSRQSIPVDKPVVEEILPRTYTSSSRLTQNRSEKLILSEREMIASSRRYKTVGQPVNEKTSPRKYVSARALGQMKSEPAKRNPSDIESTAKSRGYLAIGQSLVEEASPRAYESSRRSFLTQNERPRITTSDLESSTTSCEPLAVKRTPATKGLQRSMTMQDKSRTSVSKMFNPYMPQLSESRDTQTFSNMSMKSTGSMPRNNYKKATRRICSDSDSQVTSRRYRTTDVKALSYQREPTQATMMLVPKNSIGVWKFGEDNFFTTVPKAWSVSDCIAHVRNKIGRFGYGDLDLWIKNRCIMLDKGKSLSDYPGLKSLYVIRRPSSRDPHPFHQTSRPDDTDPFSDDTCVAMPCGHAVSPENLYLYAWKKIQNGGIEVTCPAIPDINKPGEQCSKTWEFKSISKLACLSNDENNLFCSKLFSNVLEKEANIYLCPVCNEAIFSSCKTAFKCFNCEKSGASFSFCVRCNRTTIGENCYNPECQESLPKIRALLKNCGTRTLVDVPNCPSVRACPVCHCIIEYDEGESCKHMTCPRNSCQTKFCFICLKVKTDKYYWPCGGAYQACNPSPRQII
ncbi:uncharacterized protein LOC117315633 [Pecten maximus]|uniref:uncharacterized protein LOC117315633 n=1 Tax=Pecten maximus TaxID=6579 RepID=UPI001458FB34|nr:uncharacterized protein LOC117315633 [Pecten maximus]